VFTRGTKVKTLRRILRERRPIEDEVDRPIKASQLTTHEIAGPCRQLHLVRLQTTGGRYAREQLEIHHNQVEDPLQIVGGVSTE
jgi:hypothetical protein